MAQPASPEMNFKKLPVRELLEYFLSNTTREDAWKEFQDRVQPVIQATILRELPSHLRDLREDIFHDVLTKLIKDDYRRLRKLNWPSPNSIFGWLQLVSRNTVLDELRRHKVQLVSIDCLIDKGDGKNHRKANEVRDLRRKVDDYLLSRASKPHYVRDRNIFWLAYRWGYTDKAIATLPGINLPPKKVENIRRQLLLEVIRELRLGPADEPDDS